MRPLSSATFAGRLDHGVRFDFEAGWCCQVLVLADDLFRVLFLRNDTFREPCTWTVAPGDVDVPWTGRDRRDLARFACPPFTVSESDHEVILTTELLSLRVKPRPFGLHWSFDGKPFAADRATYAYQWSERSALQRHYMARAQDDRYFGLGDKTGAIDLHGRRLRTLALDALGYDAQTSDPLYKHWPYLLGRDAASGIAYGVYYDTLAPTTFDLGCEYDNYHGFYRYAEIDDGDLDYYVFVGPRIRDVVRKFSELTGRMAFGPRWSLGYANTAMSLTDAPDAQARLAEFLKLAAMHDIPLSAFHFGSGYTSIGKRRYVFTWNRDKFPDPRAAIDRFKHHNVRVVVNLKPCLLDDHPAYAEVAARGGFVNDAGTGTPCIGQFWDGQGAHLDFTHPEGIRWWQDGLHRQVLDYGIDAGWNDNNEYEIWDDDGQSHGFGSPLPIARSRPLHALLMTRATAEAQAAHRPGERVYTVTRAGPPGIQRYAQTWSGDNTTSWHTLRWNLRMGLTMSLSGMPNTGHDVGGFNGPVPDAELLIRWVQNGVFSPRFIMNSWKSGGEVNTPWLHAEAIEPIRAAIRLRYRLLPYLYTLFRRAHAFGEPILRPLCYEFEDDPRALGDSDDFMFGPNLLVANVLEPGQRERHVYLPQNAEGWYDFHSGRYYAGGRDVVVPAPLDHIPLFARAGAIIPMTARDDFALLHDEASRQLRVFTAPGESAAHFVLYEDDGLSLAYRDGDYAEVDIEIHTTAADIMITARKSGRYALPYRQLDVLLAATDRRTLALRGDGVELVHSR
ncbi:MAG TPA: glycoside hydrolase family 31 protein [Casimicrobiaceae bacterium]